MKRKLLVLKMLTLALDELVAEEESLQWSRVVELTLQYGKSMNVEEYELIPFSSLLIMLQAKDEKKTNTSSKHISLTHDFQCPRCKGPHFGTSREDDVVTYCCHGLDNHGFGGVRGWPGCGWDGPAEECFTIPKK